MAGLNGEARPLLHHPRAHHHSGRRRATESWAPIVFGVCVVGGFRQSIGRGSA